MRKGERKRGRERREGEGQRESEREREENKDRKNKWRERKRADLTRTLCPSASWHDPLSQGLPARSGQFEAGSAADLEHTKAVVKAVQVRCSGGRLDS